jgi:hypothetical protein
MFILGRVLPIDVEDLYQILEHDYNHKSHVINFLVFS